MIFEALKGLNHAVVISFVTAKGLTQYNKRDCFIIGLQDDKHELSKLGFRWNSSFDMYTRDMNRGEYQSFKDCMERYRLALSCDDGKVYELKNRSFKHSYEACKEAVIQG